MLEGAKAAVIGIAGPELTVEEAALLRRAPPAGVILFGRNIETPGQLADLTSVLRAHLPPGAVLLVDQEGGRVARLRPPWWQAHPAAGAIGAVYARDAACGLRLAWLTGALIGLDCGMFDVVCAPVLDVRAAGSHAGVVGDRSFSADPPSVAALGAAFADGVMEAGKLPVMKHMPGHGRAVVDSHDSLPVVRTADLAGDILPFARNAALPWGMTAHIVYESVDARLPGTVSPRVVQGVIRGVIGFDGVLISDDLAMGALSGDPASRALAALAAGCDLACYCAGDMGSNTAVLDSVPVLTPEALARVAGGRARAAARRKALDPVALRGERQSLLA
jgi:beta-N-acetylhexosaminidase